MSARQNNKKRKARNVINRERTVTTLTEDPESAFLVPTPTEEPAAVLMSAPFPLPPNMQPGFPLGPGDFGHGDFGHGDFGHGDFGHFPYNVNTPYIGPMGPPSFAPQHPTPPQFFPGQQPPPDSPLGDGDLEILENLKQKIKNGQHEVFKAVPNPAFLANLYMGPRKPPLVSQVPPHPEQLPTTSERNGPVVSQAPAEPAPSRGPADTSAGAEAVPAPKPAAPDARRVDNVPSIRDVHMRSPAPAAPLAPAPSAKDARPEPPTSNAPAPPVPASNVERVPEVKQEVDERLRPRLQRQNRKG
ncbi:hypothetical protein EVJ58_g8878 [Rhodofomes roseus]|uniref:Uncharacterized protein n=1 Tax=Rhodofomes roseus TaxID=34475 RepID=A0A4Y9XWF4_9APHY|nr:hypothetical protein EVJ58_g8878 [Rhodofomes roseus]